MQNFYGSSLVYNKDVEGKGIFNLYHYEGLFGKRPLSFNIDIVLVRVITFTCIVKQQSYLQMI